MEQHKILHIEANRLLKTADHMLTTTYPLVNDPKLLLAILQNTMKSMDLNIAGLLAEARSKKLIPVFNDAPESRLTAFKLHFAKKLAVKDDLVALSEMKELLKEHKLSPVEFTKKEKLVICDENYKIHTLTPNKLKSFLNIGKHFHTVINNGR